MERAYVLINCETGDENSVLSNLRNIDSVKEAHGIFGAYDIIASLESDDQNEIRRDLTKTIRKIKKIRATLTLIAQGADSSFAKRLSDEEKKTLERYMAQAYVLIDCKKTDEYQVLRKLSQIPAIIEGNVVIGSYDIVCRVLAPTYNDISDVVTKKIRKLENIKVTRTLNLIE